MESPRAIIHVDMDAFYAAVEQHDRPELRGLPVVVGTLGARSVVSTCSYEARPFGVRSAMPTVQAQRLCPQAIFVAPRMERYKEISQQVFGVFSEVTPQIEGLSLDEAFLDVTASLRLFGGDVAAIGRYLKTEIKARTALNASVGMAHNKLLAKLASELSKPDGFLHLRPEMVHPTLDPLPVGRLWTVGKVAESALHRVGVRTIGELRRADPRRLREALGNQGEFVQRLARGEDTRPVVADAAEKSLSAETTFEQDLTHPHEIHAWLARLAERVGERVRAHGLHGKTLTVKLRTPPFETHTRQAQLPGGDDSTDAITAVARALFDTWWAQQRVRRIRLLGVGLSGFGVAPQRDLFDAVAARTRDALADNINRRFGHGTLTRAAVLRTRRDPDDAS